MHFLFHFSIFVRNLAAGLLNPSHLGDFDIFCLALSNKGLPVILKRNSCTINWRQERGGRKKPDYPYNSDPEYDLNEPG